MIDRIKALFSPSTSGERSVQKRHSFADLQIAAAALLVEGAQMDANFDTEERSKIVDLVRSRFGLSESEGRKLVELANEKVEGSGQLYYFTREIKDNFDHEERVEIVEMLWEVVYADGELHDLEASLLRRIAGLIYVSDRESGEARKRVLDKLGISG